MPSKWVKSVLGGVLAVVLALSFVPAYAYAQNDYELLGSRTYADNEGNYHIVGEVKNNSTRTWRFVGVTVPLLDDQERVLAAPTGILFVEYLRPGESGAFHIISANGTGFDAAVAYAVHLDYLVTDQPEGALEVNPAEISRGSGGGAVLTGEVENRGNVTATEVQVSAALYDDEGNLIDTTVGFSDDIPAGDSVPFTLISAVRDAADVDHISFNAQSREYVLVPEFPMQALGLVAGIGAAIALARRRYGYLSIFRPSSM